MATTCCTAGRTCKNTLTNSTLFLFGHMGPITLFFCYITKSWPIQQPHTAHIVSCIIFKVSDKAPMTNKSVELNVQCGYLNFIRTPFMKYYLDLQNVWSKLTISHIRVMSWRRIGHTLSELIPSGEASLGYATRHIRFKCNDYNLACNIQDIAAGVHPSTKL